MRSTQPGAVRPCWLASALRPLARMNAARRGSRRDCYLRRGAAPRTAGRPWQPSGGRRPRREEELLGFAGRASGI